MSVLLTSMSALSESYSVLCSCIFGTRFLCVLMIGEPWVWVPAQALRLGRVITRLPVGTSSKIGGSSWQLRLAAYVVDPAA